MTEELDLHLPRIRLRALAWGPVEGPLAVLLHGFPDTAHTWRHLGPHLAAQGWRVVAPWTRGYAPSGLPDDDCFQVGALMRDAVELHAAMGGDERAVLVGHDWGAITANGLAAHPDSPYARVVSLAVPPLAAMAGLRPDPWGWARVMPRQLRNSWYLAFNQLPLLPERLSERLVRRLWADWSPGYAAGEDLAHLLRSLRTPGHRSAPFDYYRAMARPWTLPEEYADLQRAALSALPSAPLLVLHGADDGCLRVELARRAAHGLPANARLEVVAGAGHFLHLERPEEVGRLVGDFLAAG